ncbi:hypothetical protein MMIC_P1472 [Mariprofundus micogutta]|uniref:EF-hand domain-containing protein n=2 Tax=Mariprofundus micogutta TaxID=1921010 RepID=A0A1L8CNL8_9PROT|nr:hypothetical protein MMIC_P1472 [Mariprofundus micogutta]
MKQLFRITILASVFLVSPLWAAGGLSVDAKFDLTGDGIIDASDWGRLTEDAKKTYAYESVQALGEDPYAILEEKLNRGDRYLQGLRAVYE